MHGLRVFILNSGGCRWRSNRFPFWKSFMSCMPQIEKDLLNKTLQFAKKEKKRKHFPKREMQPFPFCSSPFERFWRKTSGTVRCCSLHENLQLVSAEILIAALSHRQEPHTSRECRKPDCPGACSVGLFVPPGTTVLEHAPSRRPTNNNGGEGGNLR